MAKHWTDEDINYLCDRWGCCSIPAIAKKLNRSINSVKIKAQRIGLGPVLMSGDYVSLNQISIALLGSDINHYKNISWIQNRKMPVHTKTVNRCKFRVVYLDEFWKWAEENRSFIDFSKMEPLSLGIEPSWVAEQRKIDYSRKMNVKTSRWTPDEDAKLKYLISQNKYGFFEIASILHRTEGAVQRRINDLGIKEKPIKRDTHGDGAVWSDEHYKILADGIRSGLDYATIAGKIGKSEKSIRGKVYNTYFTERADKVRAMLQDGEWGYGATSPTVKQAKTLSKHGTVIKRELTSLVTILRYRINEMGYEPYWQRLMCANWDEIKGCLCNCSDCDSCTEFKRILPQYCCRCGKTFLERAENKFCPDCRNERKRQAQKHWAKTNRKVKSDNE